MIEEDIMPSPCTWEWLRAHDLAVIDCAVIRTPEMMQAYNQHRADLTARGISGVDDILAQMNARMAEVGTFIARDDRTSISYRGVLDINLFPYWLESGIEHYIWWRLPGTSDSMYHVKNEVSYQMWHRYATTGDEKYNIAGDRDNIVVFENTDARKSIPIPHYHIFVRHSRAIPVAATDSVIKDTLAILQ